MPEAGSRTIDRLVASGAVGGRTAQIVEDGSVVCATYPLAPLEAGMVRIRTVRSAISPGTEMTFFGRDASNVYLHKSWDPELRLFVAGTPALDHPVTFGYRAAGIVVETRSPRVAVDTRVFGNWRHTEFTVMPGEQAAGQLLPDGLDWDDGVDIGQMGPICVNAALFGEGEERGRPAVIVGAGPVGLITAQVVRAAGADPVHLVDRIPERLAIGEALGLEVVLVDGATDVAALLKRRHGSDGIPVAWECSGAVPALHEAIRIVRRRGTVVAVGFYQGDTARLRLDEEFHHNAVRIVAGQIGNPHPPFDRPALQARTLELVGSGRLQLGRLPRRTLPIERVAEGFDALTRPAEVLQVALAYE
jgi:NADPH:quinone reductase-like Zn-dependent oxidoreductase